MMGHNKASEQQEGTTWQSVYLYADNNVTLIRLYTLAKDNLLGLAHLKFTKS